MKRRGIALLMLLVLILIAVFPAAAQEESTPESTPVTTCTPEQITETLTNVGKLGTAMTDASKASAGAQSVDQLSASLAAWGNVYLTFNSDVYPNFPQCADGILLGDTLGLLLSEQLTLTSAALLNVAQTAAGDNDADTDKLLTDLVTAQAAQLQNIGGSFSGLLGQLQKGTGLPSWLAACTAEQDAFIAKLDDFETTYADQQEGLQTYLDEGTVDADTYAAVMSLISDLNAALKDGAGGCAELYPRVIGDVYLFNDTFTTLNLGQALPYLADNASAEDLTTLSGDLNAWLSSVINPEATPEPE